LNQPDHDQPLSHEQAQRYARQVIMPLIGVEGQRRLLASSVLIVGAGGLGSPAAYYLAAAGVGRIGLVDEDVVDLSNLQRQILHRTADIGLRKVTSGARSLRQLNPDVRVDEFPVRLTGANAPAMIHDFDLVIGALDNLGSRYVLNDACVAARKPLVEAGVLRMDGLVTTILPGSSACYRCLFPVEPDPANYLGAAVAGVLGPVAGLVGCIQAVEAIKVLLSVGQTLAGRLLMIDALNMSFRTIEVHRNPGCAACGTIEATAGR
jgi:adenylyltransferase/sulfurtransferase